MSPADFRAECDSADSIAHALVLVIAAIPVVWLALLAWGLV